MTTLTGKEVLEIDALLLENKMTLTAIGNRYNVSRATILAIKSGKNWSHLTHRKFERHLVGDLLGEIWIPIIGYEDSYQVSNYGRVKNVKFVKKYRNYECSRNKTGFIPKNRQPEGY